MTPPLLPDALPAPVRSGRSGTPRIGYLVQQFPPEVGAGAARAGELCARWRDAGARVTVVTGMPNRPEGRIHPGYRKRWFVDEEWDGIRVLRSWLYARPGLGTLGTLVNNATFLASATAHALSRVGPLDVLIASSPPFLPLVGGDVLRRLRGVPLVLELRDLWPDYLIGMGRLSSPTGRRLLLGLERRLLQRSAAVVVVTDAFRRRVVEKGVPDGRVHVIPNGVDPELYHPEPDPAPLPGVEKADGEFIVGYLGNFGAGQDLGQVVDAAALVLERNARIRFVLAGDGTARREVEARVADLGAGRVHLHGSIPKSATRDFYNACDLCLVPLAPFPVLQQTVPSKLFEIMACGRPVLAALDGEGRKVVEEAGCGFVVAPGDPEALADAVLEAAGLPGRELERMGARGRPYVIRHVNRDELAVRYLELLSELSGRGRLSRAP